MESDLQISGLRGRLADAEAQLARNNKVLAEVVDKYVRFKKNGGAVSRRDARTWWAPSSAGCGGCHDSCSFNPFAQFQFAWWR